MIEFLELLKNKYGGVDAYLAKYTDLTLEDMNKIRANLLLDSDVGK